MAIITPSRGYTKEDTQKRREWLQNKTGFNSSTLIPEGYDNLKGIIENFIGCVPIPMGIAGPLTINGTYAKGQYYIPLATMEGTLIMSMTRGLFLTSLCGGIETNHIKQEISRSPLFHFKQLSHTKLFVTWIEQHFNEIKHVADQTTRHGKLLRIECAIIHDRVILDLIYSTAEAAGQNMVTFASKAACEWIITHLPIELRCEYFIECNFNGDKKPTFKNFIDGRGHSVVAKTVISNRHALRILRLSTQQLHDRFWRVFAIGTYLSGATGFHLHVANALTAIYLATGQDVACVAENALGILDVSLEADNLNITLTMPSITVGTIGGGTRFPVQKENLQLLGCEGPDSAKKFAEIVCACTLALELSLMGAVASHEFADAHANYGRG